MCAVLENYQTSDGLIVPEVLRKYIPGQISFIPYAKEPPGKETKLPIREDKK